MTLNQYLDEAQIDRFQFAERINVAPETVRRYLARDRIPNKEMMGRIALATGGKVTANDFFAAMAA